MHIIGRMGYLTEFGLNPFQGNASLGWMGSGENIKVLTCLMSETCQPEL